MAFSRFSFTSQQFHETVPIQRIGTSSFDGDLTRDTVGHDKMETILI